MIDFNSFTVVELRQWIKEYQEKNNTSFTGLSKMRKAELYKLAVTLNNSIKDGTPITGPIPLVDTSTVLSQEDADTINKEIEEIVAFENEGPNPNILLDELQPYDVNVEVIVDDNKHIIIVDELPFIPLTQEELTQHGEMASLMDGEQSYKIPTPKAHDPEMETIYNSLNRKQKRKFNKLCKGAITLDDTEVTRERLASCF